MDSPGGAAVTIITTITTAGMIISATRRTRIPDRTAISATDAMRTSCARDSVNTLQLAPTAASPEQRR